MLQCINTAYLFGVLSMNIIQILPLLAVAAAFALRFYLSKKIGAPK
ncbi:putative membrane protein [Collimonas arenae]|uniref:Putative membrane protein n=1 Tax=Collimonas arenae TaxID=279058 RepID=A0A127QML7_9BURK|nr:putative membrane protein [Collimonas arenae]